jgi:hypothetical protein
MYVMPQNYMSLYFVHGEERDAMEEPSSDYQSKPP